MDATTTGMTHVGREAGAAAARAATGAAAGAARRARSRRRRRCARWRCRRGPPASHCRRPPRSRVDRNRGWCCTLMVNELKDNTTRVKARARHQPTMVMCSRPAQGVERVLLKPQVHEGLAREKRAALLRPSSRRRRAVRRPTAARSPPRHGVANRSPTNFSGARAITALSPPPKLSIPRVGVVAGADDHSSRSSAQTVDSSGRYSLARYALTMSSTAMTGSRGTRGARRASRCRGRCPPRCARRVGADAALRQSRARDFLEAFGGRRRRPRRRTRRRRRRPRRKRRASTSCASADVWVSAEGDAWK